MLPGTHTLGVLSDSEISASAEKKVAVDGLVSKGGVLAMRPLLIHASSKSQRAMPRRVLHVEYAECEEIAPGVWLDAGVSTKRA